MKRWTDGRSGEAGRRAGNLVLDNLDCSGNEISHLKGTVFVASDRCWVGRVVADDAYLSKGVLHWANVSADQHTELLQFARETSRAVFYLFVTAYPARKTIWLWEVPADVVENEMKRRGKNSRGEVLGLHISEESGRHMLGQQDVTRHHREIRIDDAASEALASAVKGDRAKRERQVVPGQMTKLHGTKVTDETWRQFDIPVSGGRTATLNVPLPLTTQDLHRVKGYIDLMEDLLMSPKQELSTAVSAG